MNLKCLNPRKSFRHIEILFITTTYTMKLGTKEYPIRQNVHFIAHVCPLILTNCFINLGPHPLLNICFLYILLAF